MGRRRPDRAYVRPSELAQGAFTASGKGKAAPTHAGTSGAEECLPFGVCALTLQPLDWSSVYAVVVSPEEPHALLFDRTALTQFVTTHGVNPATGEPMILPEEGATSREVFVVDVRVNAVGKPHCPVSFKEFGPNSAIVAVRTDQTGTKNPFAAHVYAYDTVREVALIPRNFFDPMATDRPFRKQDVVILQDPASTALRDRSSFHFILKGLPISVTDESVLRNANVSKRTKDALAEVAVSGDGRLHSSTPASDGPELEPQFVKIQGSGFQLGSESALVDARLVPKIVDEKGFVRLVTNFGHIDLVLHCELAPKTCENFIGLAKSKYYDGTVFHRVEKGFCIQGGDPLGTGFGGRSLWGREGDPRPIADEFTSQLTHSFRGVLSMANSGPNSNTSQFLLLLAPCGHLNRKSPVFGRVVSTKGGDQSGLLSMATLDAIEAVETDSESRPLEPVQLIRAEVLYDPFSAKEKEIHARDGVAQPLKVAPRAGQHQQRPLVSSSQSLKSALKPQQATTKRPVVSFNRRGQGTGASGVGKYLSHAKRPKPAAKPSFEPAWKRRKEG